MTDIKDMPDLEEILAISDPGEVGREHHGPIDRLMINFGNVVAWAFPLLVVAIVAQVFLRGMGNNQAWLDDAQWWIYGFAMLTAFGYAITTSSHVRVDIFHQNFSPEKKARIEAFAIGWLLLPFIALMGDVLIDYSWSSIKSGEGSDSPNGLHRLYILKTSLPILFLLAGLAAWAVYLRNLRQFTTLALHNKLIWAFPTVVFIGWRVLHYATYWVVRLTNSDIKPRRIAKEPIFDYLMTASLLIVIAVTLAAWLLARKSRQDA